MLEYLPTACIVSLFRGVAANEYFKAVWVPLIQLITTADNAPFALLQIGGAPRCVNMVQTDQANKRVDYYAFVDKSTKLN